jgi:Glycosyl transferase family 21
MTNPARSVEASYVLPIRRPDDGSDEELTGYLAWLGTQVDLVVIDGSDPAVARRRAAHWAGLPLRHAPPDPDRHALNGKVAGVLTGVRLARTDRIVIADEDVRYDAATLRRVIRLLDSADLVRPQNYFDPCPWHARWDTARTLLNRLGGGDYPGTLAVRRWAIEDGYDGDVLFENLELMRTIEARGGVLVTPLDCFVRRLPPGAAHFWSQRRRQAYDDFAQPLRLLGSLLVVPCTMVAASRRRWRTVLTGAATTVLAAEAGRSRAGGRRVFPAGAPLYAPLWLLERGICSWLAVFDRVVHGGCRYRDMRIRRAASSRRTLRERARAERENHDTGPCCQAERMLGAG